MMGNPGLPPGIEQTAMDIGSWIKSIFGIRDRLRTGQLRKLKGLPRDLAQKEMGALLYEVCVERASDFVNRELRRGDSPFRGISANAFFHEMLAVTFWLLDREVAGGTKTLMHELHDRYFRSFGAPGISAEERHAAMRGKYRAYEELWDEVSGHQDEFGLHVSGNIFGRDDAVRTHEKAFWIIWYADDARKAFTRLKTAVDKIMSRGRSLSA